MLKILSPYEIILLLHIYTSPAEPKECPIKNGTIDRFIALELVKLNIEKDNTKFYILTLRGEELVIKLMETSLPLYREEN